MESGRRPQLSRIHVEIIDNRDLWIAFVGVNRGLSKWGADSNANMFPDEVADLLNNDVDPDDDCGAPERVEIWSPTKVK